MLLEPNWDATFSVVLNAGVSAALCKLFIQKSLRDLDRAIGEVGKIREELAAVAVKLEAVDRYHEMMHSHDRKISALEVSLNGRSKTR